MPSTTKSGSLRGPLFQTDLMLPHRLGGFWQKRFRRTGKHGERVLGGGFRLRLLLCMESGILHITVAIATHEVPSRVLRFSGWGLCSDQGPH